MMLLFATAAQVLVPLEGNFRSVRSDAKLDVYAECVIEKKRELVLQGILGEPGRIGDLATNACYAKAKMVLDRDTVPLRPLLAKAAMKLAHRLDLEPTDSQIAAATPLAQHRLTTESDYDPAFHGSKSEFMSSLDQINHDRIVDRVAECVVKARPSTMRQWVGAGEQTVPSAETVGAAETCAKPYKVTITASELRAAAAVSFIRLAVAIDPAIRKKLLDA